ncbi:hypothetical protein GCM10017559_71930 [Streptosporangium longisporum]|uniref:histidine kinase n=1 Tax=Streptosporangium longisporum TaxID=46187 RepID=A0ABP6LBK6_9ACTN
MAVRDAGPGVSEDDHARVFDRFWRGKSGAETGETGGGTGRRDRHSGLGLAIVRQIVESHGGHVRLFSRPGQGSVFVLWLAGRGRARRGGGARPQPARGRRPPITRQGRRERGVNAVELVYTNWCKPILATAGVAVRFDLNLHWIRR